MVIIYTYSSTLKYKFCRSSPFCPYHPQCAACQNKNFDSFFFSLLCSRKINIFNLCRYSIHGCSRRLHKVPPGNEKMFTICRCSMFISVQHLQVFNFTGVPCSQVFYIHRFSIFADIKCLAVFNACRCSMHADVQYLQMFNICRYSMLTGFQCWQMFNDFRCFMCLGTPILKVFNHSWCSMFAGVQLE